VLFSPSELDQGEAIACMNDLRLGRIDGVQIDAADGSAGVAAEQWAVAPEKYLEIAREVIPEAPVWLHLFSRSPSWIIDQIQNGRRINPHLVAAIVQPAIALSDGRVLCEQIETACHCPVGLSLTVGEIEKSAEVERVLDMRILQITTPSSNDRRIERVSQAVSRLLAGGSWINLDRSVSAALLRELHSKPHGVTLGRAARRKPKDEIEMAEKLLRGLT
jgi:hypothetical protein